MRARRISLLALVALLGGALRDRPATAGADLVPVPDVAGVARAEAETTLSSQGFLVAVFEVSGTPPGTVAAVTPVPGTSLPRGATVILDVRRATSDSTPAPNAVGLSPSEASTAFGSNYALKFEAVAGPPGSRGKVVSQVPAMGAPLEIRGLLTLRFVPDDTLPPRVEVPDTLGLPSADAVRALGEAGLHARVATTTLSGAPPDVAVAQWPFPGSEFDRYSTVDLIVTAAAPATPTAPAEPEAATPVPVPNCVNLTESSARAALDAAGLLADVQWVDGDPTAAFLVQTQDPAAGTPAAPGTAVRLAIVRYAPPPPPPTPPAAPTQVALPSLVGMSLAQAEDLLQAQGLWANPVLVAYSSAPPLRVVAQQLSPGTWVDLGSVVTFRVSRPAPPSYPAPVPDFYGKTLAQAVALAALAGLNLDVHDVLNPSRPANRVYSQTVPAYSVVPVGTTVGVKIAHHAPGPTTTIVPDLSGLTESQALSALFAANLGGSASWVVAPGHPFFKVFSQWPAPGAHVVGGSLVTFQVSKIPFGLRAVPDLHGMTEAGASAAVSAAGLVPVPAEVFSPGHTPGRVFDQDLPPGTLRASGSPVGFKVARLILPTVPNVVGRTSAEAQANLVASGYAVTVLVVAALGKPPGRVWDQDPNAGALALPGTLVKIRVQPGFPSVAVPNVLGLTPFQANTALSAAGFVPSGTNVLAPPNPIGLVFAQAPSGGLFAPAGSVVQYKVSALLPLPLMATVPNLNGMTPAAAQAALIAASLGWNRQDVVAPGHPIGLVFAQSYAAGSSVPLSTTVTFKVSSFLLPPPPLLVAVPNLIGRTAAQAASDLAAAGLASSGSTVLNLLKPAHRVYSQNPAAGMWVPSGSTVHWKTNP